VPLADLLHNGAAVAYLLEFMAQHQCADYLNFWLAVEAYRGADMAAARPEERKQDAHTLYRTYAHTGAYRHTRRGDDTQAHKGTDTTPS
jgi:hypothetical protein